MLDSWIHAAWFPTKASWFSCIPYIWHKLAHKMLDVLLAESNLTLANFRLFLDLDFVRW